MSILSELKKRAGPRVRFQGVPSKASSSGGEAVRLVLAAHVSGRVGDALGIARALVRCGVSVRGAKKVVDDLAAGRIAYVEAPNVADFEALKRKLESLDATIRRIVRRPIDVKALRARLGVSQEDFAGRYGLDVATVRNWEQGRTRPDGPAMALLQLIERDPDGVVRMMAS